MDRMNGRKAAGEEELWRILHCKIDKDKPLVSDGKGVGTDFGKLVRTKTRCAFTEVNSGRGY